MNREHAAMLHAMKRAKERFGVKLTDAQYAAIRTRVRAAHQDTASDPIEGGKRYWYTVKLPGACCQVIAVYDPVLDAIVTFLPRIPKGRQVGRRVDRWGRSHRSKGRINSPNARRDLEAE